MSKKPSVSDRFHEIDAAAMEQLGAKLVSGVMTDLKNRKLSLRQVADRNNTSMGYVVQIARYHRIDPVTLARTA